MDVCESVIIRCEVQNAVWMKLEKGFERISFEYEAKFEGFHFSSRAEARNAQSFEGSWITEAKTDVAHKSLLNDEKTSCNL